MAEFAGRDPRFLADGGVGRSVTAALETVLGRALARYRARRRFRQTRDLLLMLDERTLMDIVGMTRGELRRLRGDAADRRRLGLD